MYEDPKIEEAYEGKINSVNMDIFTYNIRNACARLGNTFLLVNTRNKVQDMLLITLENAFYC